MSYTNTTKNLSLPQWVGSDKPNFDIDINFAFKQISDYVDELNSKFSEIDTTADNQSETISQILTTIAKINALIETINQTDISQSSDIGTLKQDVEKLQRDFVTLSEKQDTTDEDIETLNASLSNVSTKVNLLETNYNKLFSDYLQWKHVAKVAIDADFIAQCKSSSFAFNGSDYSIVNPKNVMIAFSCPSYIEHEGYGQFRALGGNGRTFFDNGTLLLSTSSYDSYDNIKTFLCQINEGDTIAPYSTSQGVLVRAGYSNRSGGTYTLEVGVEIFGATNEVKNAIENELDNVGFLDIYVQG